MQHYGMLFPTWRYVISNVAVFYMQCGELICVSARRTFFDVVSLLSAFVEMRAGSTPCKMLEYIAQCVIIMKILFILN